MTPSKQQYFNIVYDYLSSNDILKFYVNNAKHGSLHTCVYREPINFAFTWSDTPEGGEFWSYHNRDLCKLLESLHETGSNISVKELCNYLESEQTIQPYEYW